MERITQEEEMERLAVSGFCEAILSTAVFECSLEDILHKQAAEANGKAWKMKLKGVKKEEKKPDKDVDVSSKQRKELTITKIHEQRIAENPLKNAVGQVNKDPVQISELNGSFYDKETEKDEQNKKREMIKEEKLREKKAKEEEKIVQRQYKAIDKSIKNYTKDVKLKWKKEEKRRKEMKKMEKKAQRMLEKEMKNIEKESVKDEKKKQQAIDVVQETVKTKEETKKKEDEKDQTIDVDGETHNDLKKRKTKKGTEMIKEKKISCDVIKKNERKENDNEDTNAIETSTNNAGKKNTFAARIGGFFRYLSCIKGQKTS
ncbi:unnamed protein product [Mytilus coruscus]|uniref:Uncharacterized protein n=1 Tax=Mytilus coruscus TaxID=42192 RepID=A0A6J8C7P5_MYTCO|nr:unnamed protein product [Mytilus coruscus]